MTFELGNDKPHKTPPVFLSNSGTQRVLFSGLDCCPGQLDLFQTDGTIPSAPLPSLQESPSCKNKPTGRTGSPDRLA